MNDPMIGEYRAADITALYSQKYPFMGNWRQIVQFKWSRNPTLYRSNTS